MQNDQIIIKTNEVGTNPIDGTTHNHIYLVYRQYDPTTGSYDEFYARGGPSKQVIGTSNQTAELIQTTTGVGGTDFGYIVTEYGEYEEGSIDYDPIDDEVGVLVLEEEDLSNEWEDIKDAMDDIEAEKHTYRPLSDNSNTAVSEALDRAGLPTPEPAYNTPGYDGDLPEGDGDYDETILRFVPDWIEDLVTDIYDVIVNISSPLVLDLDMDGSIELTAYSDTNTTFFDLDEDGFSEQTGWISADDGLLAIDVNQNGIIDDSSELFGRADESGFYELALLDSNADGIIDANDTQFDDLLIWRDSNEDALTDNGELQSLSYYNITSISLGSVRVDGTNQGHYVSDESSFTVDDGMSITSHKIQDIWFEYDEVNNWYKEDYTLDVSTFILPTLRGYGEVADLHIAVSIDNGTNGLLSMMFDLTSYQTLDDLMSHEDLMADVRDIMHRWAGVDGVSPTSRGSFIDARDLEFLEKFTGQEFLQHGYNPDPGSVAANALEDTFLDAQLAITARLLLQAGGADLFSNSVSYDLVSDEFTDPGALSASALSDLETLAADPGSDAPAIWQNVLYLVTAVRGGDANITGADITALDTAITNSDAALDFGIVYNAFYGIESGSLDVNGTSSGETLNGGGYDDHIDGKSGHDTLYGHGGDDYIATGTGDDVSYGGDGHDIIYNYSGDDTFYGGAGADLFESGTGSDTYVFNQGDGQDTIYYAAANDNAPLQQECRLKVA